MLQKCEKDFWLEIQEAISADRVQNSPFLHFDRSLAEESLSRLLGEHAMQMKCSSYASRADSVSETLIKNPPPRALQQVA